MKKKKNNSLINEFQLFLLVKYTENHFQTLSNVVIIRVQLFINNCFIIYVKIKSINLGLKGSK